MLTEPQYLIRQKRDHNGHYREREFAKLAYLSVNEEYPANKELTFPYHS